MKQRLVFSLILISLTIIQPVAAATDVLQPKQLKWPFEGIFGTFDRQAIQRGFQVYKEVCATCHSLKYLSYRNLEEVGFTPEEVKSLAAEYSVPTIDNQGNNTTRPALPSDNFVAPFPNDDAARFANGGALPPDQSLLIKTVKDGSNFVHAVLTGYATAPEGTEAPAGKFYNPYFPGHFLAMPPPLQDGLVTYSDGTEATVDQMSRDVVNFLYWAADPDMEKRKDTGFKALLYLVVFTIIFYIAKIRVWSKLNNSK